MWRDTIHICWPNILQNLQQQNEREKKLYSTFRNPHLGATNSRKSKKKKKLNFKIILALREIYWKIGHNFLIDGQQRIFFEEAYINNWLWLWISENWVVVLGLNLLVYRNSSTLSGLFVREFMVFGRDPDRELCKKIPRIWVSYYKRSQTDNELVWGVMILRIEREEIEDEIE